MTNSMEEKLNPKISMNPLVEYVGASEKRRWSIIRQQKYPSGFIIGRYRMARTAFADFFKDGFDVQVLERALGRLRTREPKSDWTRNDTRNSVAALRSFLEMEFPFRSLKCRFAKPEVKAYTISGVEVVVAPDLLLEWEQEGGVYAGAVKFYIKKKPLSLQEGNLAASLLADFMKCTAAGGKVVSEAHCMCIDVMGKRIFTAAGHISEDMEALAGACDEIRDHWLAG